VMHTTLLTPHKIKMSKTKTQKARARAQKQGKALKPRGSRNVPRVQRAPKALKQLFIGPRLLKKSRRGRASGALSNNKRTFSEMLISDGLNKALQMHNSASIVDHFPRRMEKVCDIIPTSTSFAIFQALYLNPGNSVLFPIFSQIAATYEQFRCRFLKFHYVSEAYTASGSNISAGKIIMATNADPNDAQFNNSTQMENYAGADRSAPFSNLCHDVVNALKVNKTMPLREYYVNPGANTASPATDSTDKFFDMGLFQFATSGLPSASSVEYGELYVEFEFDMIRPKQQTPLGQSLLASHLVESSAGSGSAAAPLGTGGGASKSGSNIPSVTSNTTFTLPVAGNFLVVCSFIDGGTTTAVPILTPGTAISKLTVWAGDGFNASTAFNAAGITTLYAAVFSVVSAGSGVNNTITITGLTGYASGSTDIWISQVPSSIITIVDREECKEIDTLKSQVRELGAMFRALLVKIPDEEKEIDCGNDIEDLSGPARLNKLLDGIPIVAVDNGKIISSSRKRTTPSNNSVSGWFASPR